MTNQSSDTQPALRPLNVSVRGGRLTKFKGQVASIAPGLSVVATAAVLFSGSAVQADNECGSVANGQVTCGADADDTTSGIQSYDAGITYNVSASEDLTVTLNNPTVDPVGRIGVDVGSGAANNVTVQMGGGTITTTAAGGDNHGIRVDGGNGATSTAKVVVTGGKIEIDGLNSVGLYTVVSGDGDAIAELGGNSSIVASVDTKGERSYGIDVFVNKEDTAATATALLKEGGEIETKMATSNGIVARTRGGQGGALAHMSGGKITTHGEVIKEGTLQEATGFAHAVVAVVESNAKNNSKAKATALMTGGTIVTELNNSAGVRAVTNLASFKGEVEARMEGADSTITTKGNQSHGLQAFATGADENSGGVAKAVMVDGTITIHNINAHGAHVLAGGGKAKALVEMHGGSITTHDSGSYGLYARIDSPDNDEEVRVKMTGGSIVTHNTFGLFAGSHGIHADTNGSGDVIVDMSEGDGTITTVGRNSHGIFAEAEGVGSLAQAEVKAKTIVKLGVDAEVTALGSGSDGIRVSGLWVNPVNINNRVLLGVKEFDIDVAGFVMGGADARNPPSVGDTDGAAIRTVSDVDGGGTIDIASTGWVVAGRSGLAIVDGDGAAVINSAGTIRGDIRLGAGNDILNLTGGRFTGYLYAGDGDDSVTISATTEYHFSHALDGGAGDNDHLTLHGRTMTSMENVRNWEHLTLKDEMEMRLDGVTTVDMGLSIDATSTFRASGGGRGTGATIAGKVASASGGGLTITGDVTNAGDLTLSVQDGAAGDVITIDGDYTNTGSGRSVFELDAVMGADGANTDRLEITGNASGEMVLSLAGLDNASAGGGPLEIYVASVGGASDDATFTLMDGNHVMPDGEHGVVSGAYLYRLAEVEAQDGGKWWALSARSESGEISWGPSAPIYDSYGASLLAFNAPSGLQARGSS
ncbi:hypothetical protein, partial [uncultured Tateyamaria sp.]|uniref:hypothetical protein n=1 Tax=uncultured Tateyamaria sp. TaxID=455651 RepID=UPI00260EA456